MDAPVNRPTEVGPRGASPLDELAELGSFAAEAARLAACEARLALSGAAVALLLLLGAATGVVVVAGLLIVAGVFALHALGLPWYLACLTTAAVLGLLSYLALKRAGRLARRLTLPVTRQTLQPPQTS